MAQNQYGSRSGTQSRNKTMDCVAIAAAGLQGPSRQEANRNTVRTFSRNRRASKAFDATDEDFPQRVERTSATSAGPILAPTGFIFPKTTSETSRLHASRGTNLCSKVRSNVESWRGGPHKTSETQRHSSCPAPLMTTGGEVKKRSGDIVMVEEEVSLGSDAPRSERAAHAGASKETRRALEEAESLEAYPLEVEPAAPSDEVQEVSSLKRWPDAERAQRRTPRAPDGAPLQTKLITAGKATWDKTMLYVSNEKVYWYKRDNGDDVVSFIPADVDKLKYDKARQAIRIDSDSLQLFDSRSGTLFQAFGKYSSFDTNRELRGLTIEFEKDGKLAEAFFDACKPLRKVMVFEGLASEIFNR
eukprot:6206103-Pleurochrysis_carterae.AAC.1